MHKDNKPNEGYRRRIKNKIQNGRYEEYKGLSICRINDFYPLINGKIRYQVHSYYFSQLFVGHIVWISISQMCKKLQVNSNIFVNTNQENPFFSHLSMSRFGTVIYEHVHIKIVVNCWCFENSMCKGVGFVLVWN